MRDLLIIVPALNEAENLAAVLDGIRGHLPHSSLLVINDGSSDSTAEVARARGADVVDMPFNVGIGASVQAGLLYAVRNAYLTAMQVDGDGQHPASETTKLLTRLREGDCDVVIGSRFVVRTSYRGSPMRRAGIAIFAGVTSLVLRRRITDPTSGFRIFNRRAIEFLASDYPHDFPEPESIVTLCRNGFGVVEVPVEMAQRHGGRSSITLTRSIYYMIKVILAILIGATRARRIG